eukprot:scaffold2851_cov114-Isochrysis_galbana.AAC.7
MKGERTHAHKWPCRARTDAPSRRTRRPCRRGCCWMERDPFGTTTVEGRSSRNHKMGRRRVETTIGGAAPARCREGLPELPRLAEKQRCRAHRRGARGGGAFRIGTWCVCAAGGGVGLPDAMRSKVAYGVLA